MSDLIMMIVSALGAVALSVAAITALGMVAGLVVSAVGGVATAALDMAPAAVCMGGVFYAASRTGYD